MWRVSCKIFHLFFPFVFLFCPLLLLVLSSAPAFVLLSCSASWLAFFPALGLLGLACVGCSLSLSDGIRYEKRGAFLRPFLWSCVALILSNINPYIFRLGFHKIRLYWCKLSGCGRFLLSLPAFVPALLHPSNTGRCFRGLPALLG